MGSAFVGFGLYVAAIAAIGIVLSAYLLRSPADNLKEGFDSLKDGLKNKFSSHSDSTSKAGKIVETPENSTVDKENSNTVV
jgi:hypothetical protein